MKDLELYSLILNEWNTFDPIGVYVDGSDWPDDEYTAYAQATMQLLKRGSDFKTLHNYINSIIKEHMLLTHISKKEINDFANKLFAYRSQFLK